MLFLSDDVRRNPYPLYERCRLASPVLHEKGADFFLLFGYDAVKRALTDHENFGSTGPDQGATGRWLIFLDPPRHTKLRALILRAFTPRAIADLEPRVRALSASLLDRLGARSEIDLVGDYAVPLPLMVIAEMLGAPPLDYPHFRRWSDITLGLIHTVSGDERSAQAAQKFQAATEEMRGYLHELLQDRRVRWRDDLLTRLSEAEVDGERLDFKDILGFFQILLVAGHETTTNLISNAVLSFLDRPDELLRLRAAPELLPKAIEEVLRYRSPVQAALRHTRDDVTLDGHTIPKGKLVIPMIGSANRDPAQFPEPERFDITRDPNPHIAFGHGIHFCIGTALARLEAKVALTDLLERMKTFELTTSTWEPREAFHVHGPVRLPLRFGR